MLLFTFLLIAQQGKNVLEGRQAVKGIERSRLLTQGGLHSRKSKFFILLVLAQPC